MVSVVVVLLLELLFVFLIWGRVFCVLFVDVVVVVLMIWFGVAVVVLMLLCVLCLLMFACCCCEWL